MTTATDAPVMSDGLWNSLFSSKPDACRVHHCWVDQCPAGAHNDGDDREGAAPWSTS